MKWRRLEGGDGEEPERRGKAAAPRESHTPPTGSSIPSSSTLCGGASQSRCPAGEPPKETPRREGETELREAGKEEAALEMLLAAAP